MNNTALDILRRFGIRPSHQRLVVLEYMLTHRNHASADRIYEDLHRDMPVISRTTVFNTLRLFTESGVVQMLSIGNNPLAFDAELSPHAHFYCQKCHTISDIPVQRADWQRVKDYGGPEQNRMQVIFYGTCAKCSRHS